jgi:hypothetical protein
MLLVAFAFTECGTRDYRMEIFQVFCMELQAIPGLSLVGKKK